MVVAVEQEVRHMKLLSTSDVSGAGESSSLEKVNEGATSGKPRRKRGSGADRADGLVFVSQHGC